jgi:hypothetical protein
VPTERIPAAAAAAANLSSAHRQISATTIGQYRATAIWYRQGAWDVDRGEDAFVPASATASVPQETMDGSFSVEVGAYNLATVVDAAGFSKRGVRGSMVVNTPLSRRKPWVVSSASV